MTCKVIHRLEGFTNAIPRPIAQHFTRFQLTAFSLGPSALAELLVILEHGITDIHIDAQTLLKRYPCYRLLLVQTNICMHVCVLADVFKPEMCRRVEYECAELW